MGQPEPASRLAAVIPELTRVLDPAYLAGIATAPLDDIRSMRSSCADLENGASFVRRLAQGRLDLLVEESKRRAEGAGGDLAALVDGLADTLSDGVRAAGSGRLDQELDPPDHVVGPLTDCSMPRWPGRSAGLPTSMIRAWPPPSTRSATSRRSCPQPGGRSTPRSTRSTPNSPGASLPANHRPGSPERLADHDVGSSRLGMRRCAGRLEKLMARVAMLSLHTSPLVQPGGGDAGGMNVYVRELAAALAHGGTDATVYVRRWDRDLPTRMTVEPGFEVVHVDAGPVEYKEQLPDRRRVC